MDACRVLVVEDERISAFSLQQRLRQLGYDVPTIVGSGAAALSAIEVDAPDIVLMDIRIDGDMDGIETARHIGPERVVPIIYLTAYAEDAVLARAAATKPYGYLVKPFSERELHATIQMALQRRDVEVALRRSEIELRRSREDFRFLFENSPLPMWVFDAATFQILEVNQAALTAYGYSREEFLAMTALDLRPEGDVARFKSLMATGSGGYLEARNWNHRRHDGVIIQVDAFSHGLVFEGRSARITVAIDVTTRNRAEEQLRQNQKMDAIGQLTGGVAHDFNNLLAIIQGNLELAEERVRDQKYVATLISEALKATERGATLTHRLLSYSRQQPLDPHTVDLADLVSGLLAILKRTLSEAIDIRWKPQPNLWLAHIDPSQLETALLNLCFNARDAMPDGGALTIEGTNAILDETYAAQNADVKPGAYALIAVTDTGSGMSQETLARAFEPFFTTKPVGRGTGLGLSMVFGFVKQSGGHVKIYSELGQGTSIKLYLPRAIGTYVEDALLTRKANAPPRANGERIMVVEDDEAVRSLAVTILEDLGYHVIGAADGPEALEHIGQTADIDLLLSDMVLPKGMSGPVLASEALKRMPHLKVLYMSGYSHEVVVRSKLVDADIELITKPFRKAELALKVREILDAR